MPRQPRRASSSGIYHVMLRRVGKQFLFEDDGDRRTFLDFLWRVTQEHSISVIAWCLMDNHVHLVLRDEAGTLSLAMKRIALLYAQHFNRKTGHVGHVFQNRFESRPVETDAYLLDVVRYVHNNPVAAGACAACEHPWSSYADYATSRPTLVEREVVLDMIGGPEHFDAFLAEKERHAPGTSIMKARSDEEVRSLAWFAIGDGAEAIGSLPKAERDERVRALVGVGLTARQVSRLTGIGENTVRRALDNRH